MWQITIHYSRKVLCAGLSEGGRGPCLHDKCNDKCNENFLPWLRSRGGPLVGNNVLFGISTWVLYPSTGCARSNLYGVYNRVPLFTNWIHDTRDTLIILIEK